MNSARDDLPLRVSLRELRLVVERIVMLLGVPKGNWVAVREVIVAAEALGLGGLAFLDERPPGGWGSPVITSEEEHRLTVTGTGIPAPFAAPALVDLAIATMCEYGKAEVRVSGLTDAGLLAAVEPTGAQFGAELRVGRVDERTQVLEAAPAAEEIPIRSLAAMAGGEHLVDVALHGLGVAAPLWWRLYHRSNEALTVDTPTSRTHAGAALVTADGQSGGAVDADPDYMTEALS